jgi:hypothetical protein
MDVAAVFVFVFVLVHVLLVVVFDVFDDVAVLTCSPWH